MLITHMRRASNSRFVTLAKSPGGAAHSGRHTQIWHAPVGERYRVLPPTTTSRPLPSRHITSEPPPLHNNCALSLTCQTSSFPAHHALAPRATPALQARLSRDHPDGRQALASPRWTFATGTSAVEVHSTITTARAVVPSFAERSERARVRRLPDRMQRPSHRNATPSFARKLADESTRTRLFQDHTRLRLARPDGTTRPWRADTPAFTPGNGATLTLTQRSLSVQNLGAMMCCPEG
ncbi:hypothetical protein B0H15DRAFT_956321 [Mycena belliarum]|uniref:Uncharacterized protein n=1 Tax=Mycena belliarum TaxID=1033014 RepID=A0AAD6XJN5_9AGAR|nr:hypothetical protein B0H15DRAFT_956321 [Mycena belliae]